MAADVPVQPLTNPCCAVVLYFFSVLLEILFYYIQVAFNLTFTNCLFHLQWKHNYSKLEQKRNYLREAVRILEDQLDKKQKGNILIYFFPFAKKKIISLYFLFQMFVWN